MKETPSEKQEQKVLPSLQQFADRFKAHVNGDLNSFGAGLVAGHPPDYTEKLVHFCMRADRKDFPHPRLSS